MQPGFSDIKESETGETPHFNAGLHGRTEESIQSRAGGRNPVNMVYTQALLYGLAARTELRNPAQRLNKFAQHFRPDKETFQPHGALKKATSYSSLESECSMEEEEVASLHRDLTERLERCLVVAKKSTLRCGELVLPARMTSRVAGDMLRAAADEPCGLRGAVIHLYVENKSGLQKLGSVTPERSLTPTFELSAVFRPDVQSWPSLKHLFGTDKVLRLRPEYRLVKKKLYSSASPIITEFYC